MDLARTADRNHAPSSFQVIGSEYGMLMGALSESRLLAFRATFPVRRAERRTAVAVLLLIVLIFGSRIGVSFAAGAGS